MVAAARGCQPRPGMGAAWAEVVRRPMFLRVRFVAAPAWHGDFVLVSGRPAPAAWLVTGTAAAGVRRTAGVRGQRAGRPPGGQLPAARGCRGW